MTEEERAGLCLNLCFGCCAHLRNLIEKEMVQYESLIMGILVPKQDKHMRVDESVDGCIRALRKLIAIAHDLYNKGKQREFQTFSKEHMSEEFNFYLGNADNGHTRPPRLPNDPRERRSPERRPRGPPARGWGCPRGGKVALA